MHIISTDENQVFAAVQEWNQNDTYNLYISDTRGVYFTLALENVKSSRGLEGNIVIDLYEVCSKGHPTKSSYGLLLQANVNLLPASQDFHLFWDQPWGISWIWCGVDSCGNRCSYSAIGATTGWVQVSDWLAVCHFQKGKSLSFSSWCGYP